MNFPLISFQLKFSQNFKLKFISYKACINTDLGTAGFAHSNLSQLYRTAYDITYEFFTSITFSWWKKSRLL